MALNLGARQLVLYKLTAPYDGNAMGGLLWNDPELGIEWPPAELEPVVNARDGSWPAFGQFKSPFHWNG